MKLYHYREEVPNFGDELNLWLIPKLFPGLLDDDESRLLLAIGSVIYDFFPPSAQKIVFGSGYGGYTPLPTLDSSWTVYGVRGPLTARALGLGLEKVSGDTAILMHRFKPDVPRSPDVVSFIPHFESLVRGRWQAACRLAGIRFIDPCDPTDQIVARIAGSTLVIAEAMHGAIVADALRVPWIAMRPIDRRHHMKWGDWSGALDFTVRFADVPGSSFNEHYLRSRGRDVHPRLRRRPGSIVDKLFVPVDRPFTTAAAAALSHLAGLEPSLSPDAALLRCVDRLEHCADRIRRDFAR